LREILQAVATFDCNNTHLTKIKILIIEDSGRTPYRKHFWPYDAAADTPAWQICYTWIRITYSWRSYDI